MALENVHAKIASKELRGGWWNTMAEQACTAVGQSSAAYHHIPATPGSEHVPCETRSPRPAAPPTLALIAGLATWSLWHAACGTRALQVSSVVVLPRGRVSRVHLLACYTYMETSTEAAPTAFSKHNGAKVRLMAWSSASVHMPESSTWK